MIIESVETHPVCEHGPALLFERLIDGKCQQFYACSAYRDQKECPLHILVDHSKPITSNRDQLLKNAENSLKLAQDKSNLLQKVTGYIHPNHVLNVIFKINCYHYSIGIKTEQKPTDLLP